MPELLATMHNPMYGIQCGKRISSWDDPLLLQFPPVLLHHHNHIRHLESLEGELHMDSQTQVCNTHSGTHNT